MLILNKSFLTTLFVKHFIYCANYFNAAKQSDRTEKFFNTTEVSSPAFRIELKVKGSTFGR